jgi:hypothetical protein
MGALLGDTPVAEKHHVINYDTFLPRLVSGLRKAWQQVRRQRPDETFFMFGIATDSDVVVLTPFWNTEEKYAREGNLEYPTDKWVVPEEGYAFCKYTDALQDEVNRYVFEDHTAEPDSVFERRQARLLKIFEQALVQLDSEGLFGTGKKRHKVLLLIDRGDCSEAETRYMHRVIKRINPSASRTKYFAAIKEDKKRTAARRAAQESAKRREEKPIKALATAFLRREQRPYDRCVHVYKEQHKPDLRQLAKALPGKGTPEELWTVAFKAKDEPSGQLHGPGIILVIVDPRTGKCAFAP